MRTEAPAERGGGRSSRSVGEAPATGRHVRTAVADILADLVAPAAGRLTAAESIAAAGVAGVGSNTAPGGGANNSSSPALLDKESMETDYENARTEDTVRIAGGKIQRLTIAAIVDTSAPESGEEATATETSPSIDEAKIQAVVQNAVGFDEARGDKIEVMFAKLAGVTPVPVPVSTPRYWDLTATIVQNASLGIAAIVSSTSWSGMW